MRPPLLSSPLRTLLAGTLLAASALVLAVVGENIGVPEPWPVLLVVGAGLLVGIPRLRHALALAVGASIGLITVWLGVTALPDSTRGTAFATGIAVLLITVVTLVSHGGLRFGLQLVGWAAMTALSGPLVAQAGPELVGTAAFLTVYATVLIASSLGLLVSQVAQLLASGASAGVARRTRPEGSEASEDSERTGRPEPPSGTGGLTTALVAPVVALGVTLAALGLAQTMALADEGTVRGPVVNHQQLIVRTHTPDGTPARGTVVTRVGSQGAGTVTVVLDDQAVTGLRVLSSFATPEVDGDRITHELSDGMSVRTIADLRRDLPVRIDVAYRLDGELVTPAALSGRSGRLEATYTVTNTTTEARELRFFDARGRSRTVTRDVSVPFAGTLRVTLDERISGVRSDDVRMTIDRSAHRELHGDVVLFAPVGSPVQTFTWSADVRDAVVPAVQVRLAPVAVADLGADAFAGVLRDLADTGGLLRTGLDALAVEDTAPANLAQLRAGLEELLDMAAVASADVNEMRALLAAQEQRRLDGDGLVHGLLAAGQGLPAGVRADTGVVYVLEVAGTSDAGGPMLPLRFAIAIVLLAAVGLLGRAVGALTGVDVEDHTTSQEP